MNSQSQTITAPKVLYVEMPNSPRSTDDLICFADPTDAKQARLLLLFSQLTHDHPQLFEQLVELVRSRLVDNRAASVHEAFERLRWTIHRHMTNDVAPLMARAVLYVHPDLNGMVKLVPIALDAALGMRVAQKKLPGDYARRLEWIDGRPLTEQPPVLPAKHPVHHRKDRAVWTEWALRMADADVPAQGELFGDVA